MAGETEVAPAAASDGDGMVELKAVDDRGRALEPRGAQQGRLDHRPDGERFGALRVC